MADSKSSASKIVTTKIEARASKLKNKKAQLENLLRSRERLNYEIKQLQKSIQKDVRKTKLESSIFYTTTSDGTQLEKLAEAVELPEEEEPQQCYHKLVEAFNSMDKTTFEILELLLAYEETPEIES